MDYLRLYRECFLIRCFEKTVEKYFENGKMRGTTHGCVGQEIIPVLVMQNINRQNDYITGTHRCHGQVLAYTKEPYRLACEMMGKKDGFNCGMGGSQHIKVGNYLTNGVTGGMAAIASGIALALKKNRQKGIVVAFLGDGGFQEGYVAETLNIAAKEEVPLLYILENNHYAMSTHTADYMAGTFENRIRALQMQYYHTYSNEIEELDRTLKEAFAYVRENRKAAFVDISTFRLCGHSKSDDMQYMSTDEKQSNIDSDPLINLEKKIGEKEAVIVRAEVEESVVQAFSEADVCQQICFSEYKELLKNM